MALIPVQHVVADMFPVDPDWSFSIDGTIQAGQCVRLDANGYVQHVSVAGNPCLGLSGDNLMDHGALNPAVSPLKNTPYSAALVIGANGHASQSTQNRVSDTFNETLSSGKMTVYRSGGRFMSDQYVTTVAYAAGGLLYAAAGGLITSAQGAGNVVGTCAATPSAYPSGVPGTDVSGSMSLGTYIDILLQV